MTKEEARRRAEVMLAYADGKEIEMLDDNMSWSKTSTPAFNWEDNNYRVKPERKIRRMTHKEFNRWYQDELVKGTHPEIKDDGGNVMLVCPTPYMEKDDDHDVRTGIMIRTDEHPEWHEPEIEE